MPELDTMAAGSIQYSGPDSHDRKQSPFYLDKSPQVK
ncbi:predicted protein [Botrytis cinerea T4]|uniref:Uncharacterized protein n=1 Tax=Botryotinia fuckeliana (strain T4) TaxID=999810 RepID=G2XSB6_BOTF4|nr:predicted protein [Botrytis cinerea T4]